MIPDSAGVQTQVAGRLDGTFGLRGIPRMPRKLLLERFRVYGLGGLQGYYYSARSLN